MSKKLQRGSESQTQNKYIKSAEKDDYPGDLELEEEDEDEHGETLCGACGENYASNEFWICCDICEKWFHGKCVKITPARAEHIKQYKCPSCSNKRSRPSWCLSAVLGRWLSLCNDCQLSSYSGLSLALVSVALGIFMSDIMCRLCKDLMFNWLMFRDTFMITVQKQFLTLSSWCLLSICMHLIRSLNYKCSDFADNFTLIA